MNNSKKTRNLILNQQVVHQQPSKKQPTNKFKYKHQLSTQVKNVTTNHNLNRPIVKINTRKNKLSSLNKDKKNSQVKPLIRTAIRTQQKKAIINTKAKSKFDKKLKHQQRQIQHQSFSNYLDRFANYLYSPALNDPQKLIFKQQFIGCQIFQKQQQACDGPLQNYEIISMTTNEYINDSQSISSSQDLFIKYKRQVLQEIENITMNEISETNMEGDFYEQSLQEKISAESDQYEVNISFSNASIQYDQEINPATQEISIRNFLSNLRQNHIQSTQNVSYSFNSENSLRVAINSQSPLNSSNQSLSDGREQFQYTVRSSSSEPSINYNYKNHVKVLQYDDFLQKQKRQQDNYCPICYQVFENKSKITILRCFHIFHEKCADLWLQKKPKCPVCRRQVFIN